MCRPLLGILSMKRHFVLIGFLHFLVILVLTTIPRAVVSWLWSKPTGKALPTATVSGAALDLCRSKQELIMENALLRQQLIVLRRQISRPQLSNTDRVLLVLLASKLRTWKSALLIVQPDTLLRWHSHDGTEWAFACFGGESPAPLFANREYLPER